ncbi:hypothetical protein AKJ61_03390 [candidate division MSBL1 archaeon SCGC-AAA259B11]|uniref:Uncharacterized protein n=1 Tax=candidate division MSBL1 archaeon SCGC-AAA259B11 TaxID=1698260 RepID=A0A133U4T6_9EURY|nr:hypothetical protein AKJ61_03390 [candidate division MSBL1 archaeon SCGC-AAA259B11]
MRLIMTELDITIPSYLPNLKPEQEEKLEELMHDFGKARRMCYSQRRKEILSNESPDNSKIQSDVRQKLGMNSWYVHTAYQSIVDLPLMGVVFGTQKAKDQLDRGHISKEDWKKRRNNILESYGEKSRKGNRCLRVVEREGELMLRVSTGVREWMYLDLHIPRSYLEKYGHLLGGSKPYRVLIRRRDDGEGYEVKITVHPEVEVEEKDRLMALDVNSGHIDWAVVEKSSKELVDTGRINCYDLLDSPTGKTETLLHRGANKILNISRHFSADVVMGYLNTGGFNSPPSQANRRVKGMCQFKLRQILKYKLPLNGVNFELRSEGSTTKVGGEIGECLGLDVHKGAAYAFAVKVVDYHHFKLLKDSLQDEPDGRGSGEDFGRDGLTAHVQFLAFHGDDRLGIDDPERVRLFPECKVGKAPPDGGVPNG